MIDRRIDRAVLDQLGRFVALMVFVLLVLVCSYALALGLCSRIGFQTMLPPDASPTAAAAGTERARLVQLLARCHDDPSLFNDVFLTRTDTRTGQPTRGPLWWRQQEIARSIVDNRITVAYTGNAIGKDYLMGTIVPWWLYTRHNSLVIVTGPSQTLLGTVTWKEIRKALDGMRFPSGARTSVGGKASPQTVTLPGIGWQALGYSTTNVERASGQHNRKLLVVVEEASGVEDEVWEALESLKYTRLIAIGNPIRAEGEFVRLIRQSDLDRKDGIPPSRRVNAIQVPSTDSPHAGWEESPFGLADKTWLDANARRYGTDSLWWRSHVLALVPEVSSEQLFPEGWLDRCTTVPRPAFPRGHKLRGRTRIAVDLGEGVGRDSSCILVRDDLELLEVVAGSALGLAEAAAHAARLALKWNVAHEDISFDRLGIGRDFANHLFRHGIRTARPYAGSGSPKATGEYTNARTEAAWCARRRINPDWVPDLRWTHTKQLPFYIPPGPWWPMLREDLATLTYDLAGNLTRLLSKEAHCDKLGRSPDRGDAFIQSFAA